MNHFKQVAPTWDTPEKIQTAKEYSLKIKSLLGELKHLNILEVGCGTGLLGANFLDSENRLLGIDTSEDMLDIFNKKFKNQVNVRSELLNLEEQELKSANFDLIISSMAFHHLKDPFEVLRKLKACLSPKGLIAIIDLDEEDGHFHPDPKKMGVHHFGFSKSKLLNWGHELKFKKAEHQIINKIQKDSGVYPIFLMTYSD